jgi:hypothetical protein
MIYLPKFNLSKFKELNLINVINASMEYLIPITLNASIALRIHIYFCQNNNASNVQLIITQLKVRLGKINV